MKIEDFSTLHIGQTIYYLGVKSTIDELWLNDKGEYKRFRIGFEDGPESTYSWYEICAKCSLEPPKQKRKVKLYAYLYRDFMDKNHFESIVYNIAEQIIDSHMRVPEKDFEVEI